MNAGRSRWTKPILQLALLSTGLLVFNMIAMPLHEKEVFLNKASFSRIELVMLIGFGLVFVFDVVFVMWLAVRMFAETFESSRCPTNPAASAQWEPFLLALGILCLILMLGEKVMADEIGRESRLGWETRGEWIILYVMLLTQLAYNVFATRLLLRSTHPSVPVDNGQPLRGYSKTS